MANHLRLSAEDAEDVQRIKEHHPLHFAFRTVQLLACSVCFLAVSKT